MIGSAPDPKEKFPAKEDFKALLEYYDNHNVVTEEGERKWQLDVPAEIISNARVASIKLDKLSTTFLKSKKEQLKKGSCAGNTLQWVKKQRKKIERYDLIVDCNY